MMIRMLACAFALAVLSTPVRAEVKITVAYREAADLFFLMDNVSEWDKGATDPLYRAEWTKRFGWSAQDQEIADRYREYRNRTMKDIVPDGILPADVAGSDPLAEYFMPQTAIDTALKNFDRSMTPTDAETLRRFYAHFAPKWRLMIGDNRALVDGADRLDRQFQSGKARAFIDRMSRFYRVKTDGAFTVLFARYPPGERSRANVIQGRYILLNSPFGSQVDPAKWDEIVMHEFAHYLSMHQPLLQKQALTSQFLTACPVPVGIKALWLFEEPLAVAWGQAAYSIKVKGRPLDPQQNWYSVPWIDLVSRAIAPSIIAAYDSEATINDGIAKEAADRCESLKAIHAQLIGAVLN